MGVCYLILDNPHNSKYHASMTFLSIPFSPREVKATESRLQAIYDAAKLGLKNDSLALAAGMLPSEYRQLCQVDPVAEMAAFKGKADGEKEMAQHLVAAAREGDAKSALAWMCTNALVLLKPCKRHNQESSKGPS